MTARRLRAYLLPTTRRAAPSASSSNTRMHAVCMVLAIFLSHYFGSYPRCERGAALRTPIDCPSCFIYSKSPTISTLFPTASATPTFPHLSEHTSSSSAAYRHCPRRTALHYDRMQPYSLSKRILSFLSQFHKHTQHDRRPRALVPENKVPQFVSTVSTRTDRSTFAA